MIIVIIDSKLESELRDDAIFVTEVLSTRESTRDSRIATHTAQSFDYVVDMTREELMDESVTDPNVISDYLGLLANNPRKVISREEAKVLLTDSSSNLQDLRTQIDKASGSYLSESEDENSEDEDGEQIQEDPSDDQQASSNLSEDSFSFLEDA